MKAISIQPTWPETQICLFDSKWKKGSIGEGTANSKPTVIVLLQFLSQPQEAHFLKALPRSIDGIKK